MSFFKRAFENKLLKTGIHDFIFGSRNMVETPSSKLTFYLTTCDSLLKINDFIEIHFSSQKLTFSNDGEMCKNAKIEYDCTGEVVDPDDWYDFKTVDCSSILKSSSGSMSYNFSAKYARLIKIRNTHADECVKTVKLILR